MPDIKLINPALDANLDELNVQARKMSEAIETFTALVQANLEDFSGLTSEQLTDTTNQLNAQASSMINLFSNAGDALARMIEAINAGDQQGSRIIAG